MWAIFTVITLAASAYCQFRAFPLYLPQHLHRAHYDPCKPVTPHCAFVMHGGHYGPRTYGNLLGVPPYTTYLENIEHAFHWVKHHITAYKKPDKTFYDEEVLRGSVSSQPLTQYVTILSAVKDLIDQVALNGAEFYPEFYLITVLKTLREVSNNPVQATGRLWARMDYFLEQISQIKSLINHKQETKCEDQNSNECDMIIHLTLDQSSNQRLSRQAELLAAGGIEVEILMKMATLIENAAYYRQAEDFLSNGSELLEPLVMAGFETMKVLEAIASLPHAPTQLYVNKNIFYVDELLNKLVSLRSDEDKAIKKALLTDDSGYDEKADKQLVESEKLDYVSQPDDYDDFLVNSVEKQDHVDDTNEKHEFVIKLAKKQDHVVETAKNKVQVDQLGEKQDHVLELANKQDHVVETAEKQVRADQLAEKQDHVVELAKKPDNIVELPKNQYRVVEPAEKQDNAVQVAKKLELVIESAQKSDKLKLIKNHAHLNELTHTITQQEPKASLKYFKPKIIINYN